MQNIDDLNKQFGIKDQLQFIEGDTGFVMVDINNQYAKATVSTYAGQLISYLPHTETEDLIFLSDKAHYELGKAIRGGVPVCWPWFGDDTSGYGRPSHGFMRNQQWLVKATHSADDGTTTIILCFNSNDDSRAIWPYDFELQLEISVGESLKFTLTTKNTGKKDFSITQALHTYFNVSDVEKATVTGLDGKLYLDKLKGFDESTEHGNILISQEIDRVYQSVTEDVKLIDTGFNRTITISTSGSSTTVVWNPWATAIGKIADLDSDHYQRFLCVETANAADDTVTIASGATHSMTADYNVS